MFSRLALNFFWLVFAIVVAADSGEAAMEPDRRVALVVGNGGYSDEIAVLNNPANDAKAISTMFRELGIEVIEAFDLDYQGMRAALRKFDRALQGADAGIFYYAGHGMEYKGQNYLFPTDAILETEGDVGLGLIGVDQVLQVMESAVPTRLVFLDACRNNPLTRSFRSNLGGSRASNVGRGLGRIDAAVGTFIAYATAPGDIAADGNGENSPFTAAMLTHLGMPGLDVSQLMQRVRNSVVEVTNFEQVPWDSSSLRGPFVFNLNVAADPRRQSEYQAETVLSEGAHDGDHITNVEDYFDSYATTAKSYQEACQQRDATACTNLGHLYLRGVGVDSDEQVAARLYRQGCDNGDAKGCTNLGLLFREGRGIDHDFDKAAALFEQGCYRGDAQGCAPLGNLHEIGYGVDQNWTKAAELYQRGCYKQDPPGCYNLGYLHELGLGVRQDFEKAASLFAKACETGHDHSCSELNKLEQSEHQTAAESLNKDILSSRNGADILDMSLKSSRISLVEAKAIKEDDPVAALIAGLAYHYGRDVKKDVVKAHFYYTTACRHGIARGCSNLGVLYRRGLGVKRDDDKAAGHFQDACNNGISLGCANLAVLYEEGFGVPRSQAKAVELFQQACDGEVPRSCAKLAHLYEQGPGNIRQDYAKAARLYKESCDGGHKPACSKLVYLRAYLR